jgi:hypothetical protein
VRDILAAAVFVFPGALFVRRREWERAEPIEIAAVAFACSAAFWAVSFWTLRSIPLSLEAFAALTVLASILTLVFFRKTSWRPALEAWRSKAPSAAWQLAFVVVVLLLRLSFLLTRVAYSGGDMTAHAAMAEEIVLADGFPKTQQPLLPISRFGEVSPGFHLLSALVSLFSGMPTYRSTILVMSVAIAGATFALYALLRRLALPAGVAAAGSAGALFLARNPQFFLQWGGAPSILAAVVLLLLLRDALDLCEPGRWAFLWRVALLAAGALLIHVLPVISFLWLAPPVLLFHALSVRESAKNLARNVPVVLAASVVLALPFLQQAPRSVSPAALAWVRGWFPAEVQSSVGLQDRFAALKGRGAHAWSWPFYLVTYLGALPAIVLAAGLARGLVRRRRAAAVSALLLGGNALLFAAAFGEFLPGWPAFYPTRIGLWLVVPLAASFAEIAFVLGTVPRAPRALLGAIFAALFAVEGLRLSSLRFGTAFYEAARRGGGSILAIPVNEAIGGAFWVTTFCRDNSAVTPEDLTAFEWIRTHTPAAAVFANNPGDGGGLIPAAAHRKILDPHYYWFFDATEMEAWRARTEIDYVYVGSQPAPPWGRRWTAEELDADERVLPEGRFGRARVYRVRAEYRGSFR